MPKINIPLLCLLPFLALFSCEKWDLEQQDFVQVEITSIDSLAIDSVRITGRILDLQGQIQDHGFIWTTQEEPPLIIFNEGKQSLGIKTMEEPPAFSKILKLEPITFYTFRAYATLDGVEYKYSDSWKYKAGSGEAFTLGIDYQRGFSLEATGRLSGTEKGLVAIKHGFCWSTSTPLPTLDDYFVDLGERRNNEIFSGTLDGLKNDSLHYIRSYAILSLNFKLDTVYGNVLAFDGNLNFWTRRESPAGYSVLSATGFTIGQKGYIGTGIDSNGQGRQDLWEYDPQADAWTQKADFPGGPRNGAVGFSIGQKGYIGTGRTENITGNNNEDFWEYDPITDSWTRKADFGGGVRVWATGFSIGPKGYICLGAGAAFRSTDLWEYDPQADTWTRKADFEGAGRIWAFGFSIGQKGYIGTGLNGLAKKDFWEYDPIADSWSQKADFAGDGRFRAAGFSIGQKGYLGIGYDGEVDKSDFWEYDPITGHWTKRADFDGGEKDYAVGFALGQKGYFSVRNEFWEYDP